MEIKELISVFEKLLPVYKEAYLQKISKNEIWNRDLCNGLCWAAMKRNLNRIDDVFYPNGYYRFYATIGAGFLFRTPQGYRDLKSRIDFMESEIKDLKRLLKKGYTHV